MSFDSAEKRLAQDDRGYYLVYYVCFIGCFAPVPSHSEFLRNVLSCYFGNWAGDVWVGRDWPLEFSAAFRCNCTSCSKVSSGKMER